MADDWQAGDLALCVHGKHVERGAPGIPPDDQLLQLGGIYLVEAVVWARRQLGLVIDNHHSSHPTGAYLAWAFRRIPPHEADEFDRETIALLNGQRVPETANDPRHQFAQGEAAAVSERTFHGEANG